MALYMCEHTLSNIGISSLRVIVGEEKEKKKKKERMENCLLSIASKGDLVYKIEKLSRFS